MPKNTDHLSLQAGLISCKPGHSLSIKANSKGEQQTMPARKPGDSTNTHAQEHNMVTAELCAAMLKLRHTCCCCCFSACLVDASESQPMPAGAADGLVPVGCCGLVCSCRRHTSHAHLLVTTAGDCGRHGRLSAGNTNSNK
jgi:hypothetical protein